MKKRTKPCLGLLKSILLFAATIPLAGCFLCAPKYASDIGSTQVAALSVTKWSDYRATLSPKFDLSAADALDKAVPDTRSYESAILDAFRGRVALRLAPSPVLTEGFGKPTAPAGATDGAPATEPGVTAAGAAAPTTSLEGNPPKLADELKLPDASKLKGDPFLKYLAATALYQEVKLLERYVQDATQRDDYEPVIVRLQLTNQPFSQQIPYDAYANIAFFAKPVAAVPQAGDVAIQTVLTTDDAIDELKEAAKKTDATARREALYNLLGKIEKSLQEEPDVADKAVFESVKAGARKLIDEDYLLPIVVPLLVTDQVESALLTGRAEQLRQMALVLAAAYAGIGGDVNLEKVDQAIEKAAGRSYQSLFSVGRLANNMLRVRMGARTTPDASAKGKGFRYETAARTHNVTLLLLVPRDGASQAEGNPEWPQTVFLATRYEYRSPETGKRFGIEPGTQGDTQAVKKRVSAFIKEGAYGPKDVPGDDALKLAQLAQGNNHAEFMEEANNLGIKAGEARRLYMDLNIVKLGGSFDSTDFEVMVSEKKAPCLGESDAYLVDNGAITEAVIDGVKGIDPVKVTANWKGIEIADGTTDKITLAATGAALRGRSQLVLSFPSLVKLGVLSKGGKLGEKGSIELSHVGATSRTGETAATVLSFIATGKPADTPKLTIARTTRQITGGTEATITLAFALNDSAKALASKNKNYLLSFDGVEAAISGTSDAIEKVEDKLQFRVKASGTVKFKISNPISGTKFTIKVAQPATAEPVAPLEYTVAAPPKSP